MGGADVLVTGDKKHLLPLKEFQGIVIEPPSAFLSRLDAMK
jgi:predicted nucleic acid-binding protein